MEAASKRVRRNTSELFPDVPERVLGLRSFSRKWIAALFFFVVSQPPMENGVRYALFQIRLAWEIGDLELFPERMKDLSVRNTTLCCVSMSGICFAWSNTRINCRARPTPKWSSLRFPEASQLTARGCPESFWWWQLACQPRTATYCMKTIARETPRAEF